jgi:hypothetical protein
VEPYFRTPSTKQGQVPQSAAVSFVICEMGGACSTYGEKRNAYRLLVGKSEGKTQLGRPRRRWVGNIRMDLGEVGWSDVDWIGLAQDRDRWGALEARLSKA